MSTIRTDFYNNNNTKKIYLFKLEIKFKKLISKQTYGFRIISFVYSSIILRMSQEGSFVLFYFIAFTILFFFNPECFNRIVIL